MKKLIIASVIVIGAVAVRADENMTANPAPSESWFQASLTPDIAIHPKTTEINGLAIDIWGENPQHSFNLGFVNGSTGDSSGFSVGLVNYADNYIGFEWGIVNYDKDGFSGLQSGLVNISHGTFNGWQHGAVNYSDGDFTGLQDGLVAISKGSFTGLQGAWINISEKLTGAQIGLVNYSKNLHGVQVGLANIAMNNGWFDDMPDKFAKGFPIVNWSF